MRTSNYTVSDVEHFAQYFAVLMFKPDATRSFHVQAMSFYWSDEMPEFVDDGYDASIRHFMIYLLSYRKVLMYREAVPQFEPLWNRLKTICPNWPGFRSERMDASLIADLQRETDDVVKCLERACARLKRRYERRHKLAEQPPSQSRSQSDVG